MTANNVASLTNTYNAIDIMKAPIRVMLLIESVVTRALHQRYVEGRYAYMVLRAFSFRQHYWQFHASYSPWMTYNYWPEKSGKNILRGIPSKLIGLLSSDAKILNFHYC